MQQHVIVTRFTTWSHFHRFYHFHFRYPGQVRATKLMGTLCHQIQRHESLSVHFLYDVSVPESCRAEHLLATRPYMFTVDIDRAKAAISVVSQMFTSPRD